MDIISLFRYLQHNKTVTGFIMPSQQAEQLVQSALQAPINNLIVVGILIALIIVLGGGFLIWKFMPIILKQIQQLIDNNIQLAKIAEQNAASARLAQQTADDNKKQLTEQTGLLREQKGLLGEQNILLTDFKNFQKANNETVASLRDEFSELRTTVSTNTEGLNSLKASVESNNAEVRESINTLIEQIEKLLNKNVDCLGSSEIQAMEERIINAFKQQPTSAVSTNVLTVDASTLTSEGGEDKAA